MRLDIKMGFFLSLFQLRLQRRRVHNRCLVPPHPKTGVDHICRTCHDIMKQALLALMLTSFGLQKDRGLKSYRVLMPPPPTMPARSGIRAQKKWVGTFWCVNLNTSILPKISIFVCYPPPPKKGKYIQQIHNDGLFALGGSSRKTLFLWISNFHLCLNFLQWVFYF